MKLQARLAGCMLAVIATTAIAQKEERKVYCWNEGGRRVCGDALPARAVDAARTEVARAPTADERDAAAAAEQLARSAADERAAQQRRELAMVESYATEADLRRAYGERIVLVEEGLKTSHMGVTGLRTSLLSLLRQAGDLELQTKPVGAPLRESIRSQRSDLQRQLAILDQQLGEQAELDSDLEAALARYRELKQPAATTRD
ncbi:MULTISPECIES: hypothetical protein [Luteimonas]|uniref:hypothetical protein n=1 Tax=Luteimonas TaxID=83614 RepID=UPI000C7B6E46|nr:MULTISPECIES: hypothetical protein [Luteimonas]